MTRIHPILMVGGSGTRLWPVSRHDRPKQFQHLIGTPQTLFQQTIMRAQGGSGAVEFAAPIIIGAERYRGLIEEQLAEIDVAPGAILLEPSARNTAAVAAVAAACLRDIDPEGLALMMPSDHLVADQVSFQDAIFAATETAAQNWIVTFGIQPTRPETGFGYIEAGEVLGSSAHRIAAFTEKPDLETAERWLAARQHSWNAGIFMFKPDIMLSELETHAPEVHRASLEALKLGQRDGRTLSLDADAFNAAPEISIDFAVMEHTQKAAVFGPLACGWSDVGSWAMLAELDTGPQSAEIVNVGSDTNYIRTDGSVFVAAVGLEDIIIVAHEGAVLIMPKDQSQNVKAAIEKIKQQGQKDRL